MILVWSAHPIFVGDIDQRKGAVDVGLYEYARVFDGVVDMAFGREMDDAADVVFIEDELDQFAVADVALDEFVAGIVLCFFEVVQIACIGQQVKIDKIVRFIFI